MAVLEDVERSETEVEEDSSPECVRNDDLDNSEFYPHVNRLATKPLRQHHRPPS